MEIGIRLHDTAGSNLEEHLRNAKEQGFSCVHIAMSKVVPGFKMADAPELLTDALADEVRGLLEKYNQRCVRSWARRPPSAAPKTPRTVCASTSSGPRPRPSP